VAARSDRNTGIDVVHESTHARLGELGLDFMSAPLRHERLCIREEEHFARRIDNARLQENVRGKHYRNVDELATDRDTKERDILDQLASLGVPSSALFVLTRLAKSRSERNRKRWRGGA